MARLVVVTATLAAALLALPALAQSLQRLTVTQLTLASDTASPTVDVPFHLIVTARVRERVTSLENLDLPILADVDVLGDEHALAATRTGTAYREVITVVAHHHATITIDPVTLDAVDAKTGKATRYSSNTVTVVVGGGAAIPSPGETGDVARRIGSACVVLLGIGALVAIVVALLRRPRRTLEPVIALPPPTPVAPSRSLRDVLGDALTTLRVERTRETAMRVRHVARTMVGASDTETLADALRRPGAAEAGMRETLIALERASFTYDADLPTAIARAIAALEGMLA